MKNIKYKSQIDIVENVLKEFPEECRKNFYDNLSTLNIKNEKKVNSVLGNYNPQKNEITLSDDSSICHELFHMSFNSQNKYRKKIQEDLYIDNGVAFKCADGIHGHSITEGFAEYLNRKCNLNKGRHYDYFFADLLISIYSEEILYFALKNDPEGFYNYERFNDIIKYIVALDELGELLKNVRFVVDSMPLIKEAADRGEKTILAEYQDLISIIKDGISPVILLIFKTIIEEYNNCDNPNISKESFVDKIDEFCSNKYYEGVFKISSNENLMEELLKLKNTIVENNKVL